MDCSIFIGWDSREAAAFAVARHSIKRRLTRNIPVRGLVLPDLQAVGLYSRPMEVRIGPVGNPIMWDVISDAPMSTQHACARFLVKEVARPGWVMFVDGDVMARTDVGVLFDQLDTSMALYCVKHKHQPPVGVKMDGQAQVQYARKNWSSVFVLNAMHPANDALTVNLINDVPGRDLHRFCWLDDSQIGELGPEWNFLVGETGGDVHPKICHFTSGTPDMPGYERTPFADEWWSELRDWAA